MSTCCQSRVLNCQVRELIFVSLLTLRYLAIVESQSLSFRFRISLTVITIIVADTCERIWKNLSDTYVRAPSKAKHIAIWKTHRYRMSKN